MHANELSHANEKKIEGAYLLSLLSRKIYEDVNTTNSDLPALHFVMYQEPHTIYRIECDRVTG